MDVKVETAIFNRKLREFINLSGKGIAVALKEQAKLLAERLVKLTFPNKAAEGKRRVEIDLNRVYLKNEWFEDTFQFRNKKLGERVQDAVRTKDQTELEAIFNRSSRLRRLEIELFDDTEHQKRRDNRGRVRGTFPASFPLREQAAEKRYQRKKQKNVGLAKRGWARCLEELKGKVSGWLTGGKGQVIDNSADPKSPSITLINKVSYARELADRTNAVSRALMGRAKDMEKALMYQLKRARKAAGFDGQS